MLDFLRFLGSPFVPKEPADLLAHQKSLLSKYSSLQLFDYACKNKLGLFFLEQVKRTGTLGTLDKEYEKELKKNNELLTSALHVSKVLTSNNIKHAVFKTVMPYPAVTNDVDVLFLDRQELFNETMKFMVKDGFEIIASAPEETMFHDNRNFPHSSGMMKDEYDVDLYRKPAVSHLVYLDVKTVGANLSEVNVPGKGRIKILAPENELVAIIAHAVIVEQLYCLSAYYATLYHLVKLNSNEISRLKMIAKETKVISAMTVHFSLTAALHYATHNFVPAKLEEVLDTLYSPTWKTEVKSLARSYLKMPHRYSLQTFAFALIERLGSGEFRNSLADQILSTLDPRFTKYVAEQILLRRKRETY